MALQIALTEISHPNNPNEIPVFLKSDPENCRRRAKDPAHSPAPSNDQIVAELNRQKHATEQVIWEATQLAQSYDRMQKVIIDMTAVAKDHAFMTARFGQTELRVARMEQELGRLVSPVPPATNDVPTILIDDPNPAKP